MERIVFLTKFFVGLIFFIFIDNQVCNDDFQSIKWPVLVKCLLLILAQVFKKIPTIVDFKRFTILRLTNIAPPKDLETVSPCFNKYYSSKSFWIKIEYPGTYTLMSLWHDLMLLCAIIPAVTLRAWILVSSSNSISFCPNESLDQLNTAELLESCIDDIRAWMLHDNLKLNDEKTELLIIGTPQQLDKVVITHIRVGNTNIYPVPVARNLGSWFDANISMTDHISKICSSSFYYLYNLRRIRKYISPISQQSHSFMLSYQVVLTIVTVYCMVCQTAH